LVAACRSRIRRRRRSKPRTLGLFIRLALPSTAAPQIDDSAQLD
jgi:hypothetical protein